MSLLRLMGEYVILAWATSSSYLLLVVVSGLWLGTAEPRWPHVPNIRRKDHPLPRLRHRLSHFYKWGGVLWETTGVCDHQAGNLGRERHQKSMSTRQPQSKNDPCIDFLHFVLLANETFLPWWLGTIFYTLISFFYAFTIRKWINYAKNARGGFAKSVCESLDDWYTAVVNIYDTTVILNDIKSIRFIIFKARPNHWIITQHSYYCSGQPLRILTCNFWPKTVCRSSPSDNIFVPSSVGCLWPSILPTCNTSGCICGAVLLLP